MTNPDNTAILNRFGTEIQELAKNLLESCQKLSHDQLHNLLYFTISETAGSQHNPIPESALDTGVLHCRNMLNQLQDFEQILFLQWLLNFINPLEPSQQGKMDLMEKLKQFTEYDLDRHVSYLGVKEPLSHSFDSYMKKIAECLREYKMKVSRLEKSIDSAISTLDLIAEAESMIQSGNWANGKAGCLSVFATRLAVQTRDCLRRSYQEKNRSYRPDEF